MPNGARARSTTDSFAVVSATTDVRLACPFVRRPRLPLVPPPYAGESLSGWVQELAHSYGLNWRSFLQVLGLPVPNRLRSLCIDPAQQWLDRLAIHTGIDRNHVIDLMTFGRLSPNMAALVHAAMPCEMCPAVTPSGRSQPVEWLADLAPWTFACERHRCAVLADEIGDRRHRMLIDHHLALLSQRLRATASYKFTRPFSPVRLGAAECVELVRGINRHIKLRVTVGRDGHIVFVVTGVLTVCGPSEEARSWQRNSMAVSAWYAWHVLTRPGEALWRNTRCRDADGAYDVLAAVFDPRQTGITNFMWDYALSLCEAAGRISTCVKAEARQIRNIREARFRCAAGHFDKRATHGGG